MTDLKTKSISFINLGIKNASIRYQLTSDELHALTIEKKQGRTTSLGAIAVIRGNLREDLQRIVLLSKMR